MKKAYKTEIKVTDEQGVKIRKTIGTCRYIYNLYLVTQKEYYEETKRFMSGYDFSKWLNNMFVPENPDKKWIKEVSSKAIKQSIMNGERAFKRFFEKESNFPKFKKKHKQDVKAYFPKNNKTDLTVQRHRIKIPTLGWVQLKEYGYITTDGNVKSCTVSEKAKRYYISVLFEEEATPETYSHSEGIGIDLGIKEFAIVNDGNVFGNINKSKKVRKLEKKLKREQRSLSRKILNRKRGETATETRTNLDIYKGSNKCQNILRVQKLHQRLSNIRTEYVKSVVTTLVKTKPEFVTIEDLNIKGMMKNRHLSKAIAHQTFYKFKEYLICKCKQFGIELRLAGRFYPSSKTCSHCGAIKKDLKLKDRRYICPECGTDIDRDLNAAINLKMLEQYTVLN
jgi:putative transposase